MNALNGSEKTKMDAAICTVSATIRQTMHQLSTSAMEIVLVVDEKRRLLGTLTDGDIRRALLSGANLESPVDGYMHRKFTSVGPEVGRAEVLDIMRARSLRHIPIVDKSGVLIGMHMLREMLGAVPRPNWAVVMAGGRGERLRPHTDSIPKPMVKVAGRPIIERIVLHLVGYGIQRIFLSINYLGELIERHFGDGEALGCRIEYIREDRPMGTGGSLSLLPERPRDPLLVLYGDLVTQFDVGGMLRFHCDGNYMITVGTHEYVHTIPYGVVRIDGGRIVEIAEKPSFSWIANAGIYLLEPEIIDRIPRGGEFPLPALIEDCLDRGESVGGFIIEEDWMDVGHPVELRRARGEVLKP